MFEKNGILIQGLNDKTDFIKNFHYHGLNAYFQFPLTKINDEESRELTQIQQFNKISENGYQSLEFISNIDLYKKYINKCFKMGIRIRALFIESNYSDELWKGELPQIEFIGYEYCPIPIDEQIITDMDWYKPFSKYWKNLNTYGLFDTYTDVSNFAKAYDQAFINKKIGDGEIDAYICKISRVINNQGQSGDGSVIDTVIDTNDLEEI